MTSLIPSTLRRHRVRRRQSLSVLGGLADMSAQHLSELESGSIDPRLSTVERVASALGLSLLLVPQDKAAEIRRYLAADGRVFRRLGPGDTDHE